MGQRQLSASLGRATDSIAGWSRLARGSGVTVPSRWLGIWATVTVVTLLVTVRALTCQCHCAPTAGPDSETAAEHVGVVQPLGAWRRPRPTSRLGGDGPLEVPGSWLRTVGGAKASVQVTVTVAVRRPWPPAWSLHGPGMIYWFSCGVASGRQGPRWRPGPTGRPDWQSPCSTWLPARVRVELLDSESSTGRAATICRTQKSSQLPRLATGRAAVTNV